MEKHIEEDNMLKYLAPLSITFVWHPADVMEVAPIVDHSFSLLSRDVGKPFSRSMNLPIFFRTTLKKGIPSAVDISSAKTIIFIFVSKKMVADDPWMDYIKDLPKAEHVHVIPIAMDNRAFAFGDVLDKKNFIRAYEFEPAFLKEFLFIAITHEIYRYALNQNFKKIKLGKDTALKIFLSHAKDGKNGIKLAKALKNFIDNSSMRNFFDATDIAPGYTFDEEIIEHIKESSMVAIHSDIYSSRYWCQREILSAKEHERPIIAVDTLEEFEDRRFPFSTNIPGVHVHVEDEPSKKDLLRILSSTLLETVRFFYAKVLLEQYKSSGWIENSAKICPRPPELSNIEKVLLKDGDAIACKYAALVYPEPPLYAEEVSFFKKVGIKVETPLTLDWFSLKGKNIGISISEPSEEEVVNIGQNSNHLVQLSQDVARYFLTRDTTLLYGGDLREGGFTEFIFHEAQVLQVRLQTKDIHIKNYTAWPIYKNTKTDITEWKAQYRPVASMIEVPCSADVKDLIPCEDSFLAPNNAQNGFVWSRCLTEMRNEMIENCNVRICAGGRHSGYKGRMPGVLEEIVIAVEKEKPLFLLGGFGGVTASVCEFIETGVVPEKLTMEWQIHNNAGYKDVLDFALSRGSEYEVDYKFLMEKLTIGKLRNGLKPEENKRLFKTPFVDEALHLIFEGLKRLYLKK